MKAPSLAILFLGATLLLGATLFPASGRADDFPQPFDTEKNLDVPRMPAERAAERWQLPPGFEASLVAAEPDVQNPIDLAWDSAGRLWIAENYTYAEREQRFQLDLRDRVLVWEARDGDGRQAGRGVFTDGVQMLTSVEVGYGGVWLMCPPRLLFVPDRDRDAVPDGPAEVVLDGFEVATQNYHNFANGLRFGPDGWLYGRCGGSCPGRVGPPGTADDRRVALEGGIWRFHPPSRRFEVLTHGTTNPWGHDWNDVGELFFVNTVNGHFWHGIPGAHFKRPFTLDPNRHTYELIDFHADHWHFDTGKSWTDSRDGAANDYGGGHAHCGLMIYRGDQWPAEYRGDAFTWNLHGRRLNREILDRRGSGYVARHAPDTMLAADPWFRGMELSYGPDGSVFAIDWSDTGECHEHSGVHRTSGRIFRFAYRGHGGSAGDATQSPAPPGAPKGPAPRRPPGDFDASRLAGFVLHEADDTRLVELQRHPNAWFAHQGRLLLFERGADRGVSGAGRDAARRLFVGAEGDAEAVAGLLTMHAAGSTDAAFFRQAVGHVSPHVRSWVIRLVSERWPLDDCYGPTADSRAAAEEVGRAAQSWMPTFLRLAAEDPSPAVRLTLASTLQRLPAGMRAPLAAALASHSEDADDHNLPLMIWYGLMATADEDPDSLIDVLRVAELPTTRRLIARRIGEQIESRPESVAKLLRVLAERPEEACRRDLLQGLADALRGWRSAPKPEGWDAVVGPIRDSGTLPLIRELSVVFGDGRSVREVQRLIMDEAQTPEIRLEALRSWIGTQPPGLRDVCEPLLRDARMNVVAAQGLATIDDPDVGQILVSRYRNFRAPERPKLVSILASRPPFARALIDAMRSGAIPRADVSAFQVRQIHSLGDAGLSQDLSEVWGEVRETSEEKRREIDRLRGVLRAETLAGADRGAGRQLYANLCQNCHRLYGQGGQIGPDLTGGNRNDMDYLLGNIIDPGAVVDKDYRMTLILTEDGRVLSGLVTDESPRTVTLHTATESFTLDRRDVVEQRLTEKSPMPEGLLDPLSDEQIRDLVSYLAHPTQVPLPAEAASLDP